MYLLWRAFSKTGQNVFFFLTKHHLSVDGSPKRREKCVFKRKCISVDMALQAGVIWS